MKRNAIVTLIAAFVLALATPLAWSQTVQVKGSIKGFDGKPLPNATVEYVAPDTGAKYTFKTDQGGNFFSIGVRSGLYNVTVTPQGGQPIGPFRAQITLGQ